MEIEEAVNLIAEAAAPIKETMSVPLSDACGYITASDIIADSAVPSFPRSAMDGYAVNSKDTGSASKESPVTLKVIGEIMAGDCPNLKYAPGTAVRVMTGAMVPEGYDSVVKQEDTDFGEEEVQVFASLSQYMNYCHAGEEIEKYAVVLKAGTRIGRTEAGLIASLGMSEVGVRRPVRVAVISTGSELCEAGEVLKPGQIYNSVRYILGTAVRQEKLDLSFECTCPDDEYTIMSLLRQALDESDIVLTTGGVSVGKKDLMPEILEKLRAERLFGGVNIQPGTPTIGSVLDGKIILSLSGNPYAAMANFDLYFWPVVSKLMGSKSFLPGEGEAVLADSYDKVNRMRRLIRAYESGGKVYLPASEHMSSVFGNTISCNCYMDIPAGKSVHPGDTVKIRRMRSVI